MFKIKLVRNLFYAFMFKIIGLTILFFMFFSPDHRLKVDKDVVLKDVYSVNLEK